MEFMTFLLDILHEEILKYTDTPTSSSSSTSTSSSSSVFKLACSMQNVSMHGDDNGNHDYLKDENDDGGGWEEVDKIITYTHIHIHRYTHTHIHTYTHIHTRKNEHTPYAYTPYIQENTATECPRSTYLLTFLKKYTAK